MEILNEVKIDRKKLASVFAKYEDIKAVYLFGSVAKNKMHLESDLDLAIVADDSKLKKRKLEILTDLVKSGYENVDLVFLDYSDIVLMYEAVKYNKVIYARDDFDSNTFFSKIVRQYLDFLPFLNVQIEAYKRRNHVG